MGIRVTVQDAKELRYCNRGMRVLFSRWGLNFELFRKHGIDSDELPKGDAMVDKVIAVASARIDAEDATRGQQ